MRSAIDARVWPDLAQRAGRLLTLFATVAPRIMPVLQSSAQLRVRLQPCIRDIWHAHVLFLGETVSGIIDFGAMRPENVAADIARLLGSFVADDRGAWQRGLAAYQSVRPLSPEELTLVDAFDRSTVLMGGLQWLEWIYLDRREFADPRAVLARIDGFLSRLSWLSQAVG
jgi:homoserine kinase type II